MLLLHDKDQQ